MTRGFALSLWPITMARIARCLDHLAMHRLNAIRAVPAAPTGIAKHLTRPVFGGRAAASLG